ncbi:hypothetical protein EVAR_27432_1 [Eumeta japonica]|uniref:Uncharacterized protein n=1 Tax=Eumeta variegata TaxID=151549 RepID=A0A4C1VMF3_EUMVA|nr:hypothetical protein EVAR_27432_1 [Eumeta japonica]
MSRAASWLPLAVADRLRAHDRSESLLLAWLATLRAQIEDYEVRPPSPEIPASPESVSSDSPDSAFDEILSQLGNEIYKLDEYQRHLTPADERTSVSHSILDLFDECLCDMTATDGTGDGSKAAANGVGDSEDESTLSEVSFVTSTPVRMSDELNIVDVNAIRDKVTPLPLKAVRPLRAGCAYGDRNVDVDDEPRPTSAVESLAGRLETDSDSESTCWSYKDCSTDTENDERDERYAAVWAHSSGYHNSDQILRRVLAQHRATESRLSFHMARELPPPCYSVYALPEPDGRWPRPPSPVAEMTPGAFDGYEPVGRALDENIYEEIDYGGSYTDEGCSCEGSVEVESCSVSAGSEAGRESPVYANLRDHDAYAIPPDVIAWKNLLLHPDYNDDEEDVVSTYAK